MKKWLSFFLSMVIICGLIFPAGFAEADESIERLTDAEQQIATLIDLSDDEIHVEGDNAEAVFTSHDIVYYQDLDAYESGNPYGEGTEVERHSEEEAQAHTVLNITKPGTYRVSGTLTAGQIRVDLGEDAKSDPGAVVNLILDNVDITCTVAPAILFSNVYECESERTAETASPDVDLSAAGANLILAQGSTNVVHGSHVAKIYKDNDQQKKLVKQDGAVYSYVSMNVDGSGRLNINADNEGLNSERHLTIKNGTICIRSQDDGINTNEDGVSVTTIEGGTVHIIAGLGSEGDGIDSNGFLVIRGGCVISMANPASDSGLDSDSGSYIHGGTVIALGSTMDWAESDSKQVTMNLQFASYRDESIVVTDESGNVVFAYDPAEDELTGDAFRRYMGAVISCPEFEVGESYRLYLGCAVEGEEEFGIYTSDSTASGGVQQMYTGSDLRGGGRMGFGRGERPDGFDPHQMQERPMEHQRPEFMNKPDREDAWQNKPMDFGNPPEMPDFGDRPEREEMPFGQFESSMQNSEGSTDFFAQDKVNAFAGITDAE